MTIKEKLEKIYKLQQQILVIKNTIDEQYMQDVCRRYIDAIRTEHRYYGYPSDDVKFQWEINGEYIEVTWNEFWNYGGHDSGSFDFPVQYLWDDTGLVLLEQKRLETIKQNEINEILKKEKAEKEQLAALKAKYESKS